MMTVYELAKTLDKKSIECMSKNGILSSNLCRDIYIYELWNKLLASGKSKTDAYYEIGIKCFTCEENVRKIVRKMSREVKR